MSDKKVSGGDMGDRWDCVGIFRAMADELAINFPSIPSWFQAGQDLRKPRRSERNCVV